MMEYILEEEIGIGDWIVIYEEQIQFRVQNKRLNGTWSTTNVKMKKHIAANKGMLVTPQIPV